MQNDKCGIYEISSIASGKSYVGSSWQIHTRWARHRYELRRNTHRSPRLQQAWNKHGEANFVFTVLEECAREVLFSREQFHIDAKKRDYNSMPKVRVITDEMRAKMLAKMRLNSEARTHCPHGHEFTPENTYYGKQRGKSDKRCKRCNAERIAKLYARETPEQTLARNAKNNARYHANYVEQRAKQNAYAARTKEKKRAYDRAHLAEKRARRVKAKLEGRDYW